MKFANAEFAGNFRELANRIERLEAAIRQLEEGSTIKKDQYFSIDEAASYLDVSRSTMYRLLRDREITYINVGRHRRVLASDLEKYLKLQHPVGYKSIPIR